MKPAAATLVSCGIFREELEHLAREGRLDGDIVFLDAALHVNFDKLKEALVRVLDESRRRGCQVRVLYGACHPEMDEILSAYGARRMAAGNCLEALVGTERMRHLENGQKTFFLSAGWISAWERMFALGREDFGIDFQALLSAYERVIVFETDAIPVDEKRLSRFQQLTQLPVQRQAISLDHLVRQIEEI